MIKKEKLIIGIFYVSFIFALVSIINAQSFGNSYGGSGFQLTDIIDWLKSTLGPFFAALFGTDNMDSFLFVKILMFFLIFSVSNFSLYYGDVFTGNRSIRTIVSFIVSLLSVRFMGDGAFIRALLVPYTAVGATLTMGLPIIFFFVFVTVVVHGNYARRILWVLFGVAFWFSYYFASIDPVYGREAGIYAKYMYGISAIFILFNIAFPNAARTMFERMGIDRIEEGIYRQQLAHLERAYNDAMTAGDHVLARQLHHDIDRLVQNRGHFFS